MAGACQVYSLVSGLGPGPAAEIVIGLHVSLPSTPYTWSVQLNIRPSQQLSSTGPCMRLHGVISALARNVNREPSDPLGLCWQVRQTLDKLKSAKDAPQPVDHVADGELTYHWPATASTAALLLYQLQSMHVRLGGSV